jgi:hypothetical protein
MGESVLKQKITTEQETVGEVRLWQAVLVRAIEEWMSGPAREQRQAEHYLFHDKSDFALVCQSAGLNPDDLRARLTRIRNRQLHQAQAIAA